VSLVTSGLRGSIKEDAPEGHRAIPGRGPLISRPCPPQRRGRGLIGESPGLSSPARTHYPSLCAGSIEMSAEMTTRCRGSVTPMSLADLAARRRFESPHLHQLPIGGLRGRLCRADHELSRLAILCFRIETDISCFRFESRQARRSVNRCVSQNLSDQARFPKVRPAKRHSNIRPPKRQCRRPALGGVTCPLPTIPVSAPVPEPSTTVASRTMGWPSLMDPRCSSTKVPSCPSRAPSMRSRATKDEPPGHWRGSRMPARRRHQNRPGVGLVKKHSGGCRTSLGRHVVSDHVPRVQREGRPHVHRHAESMAKVDGRRLVLERGRRYLSLISIERLARARWCATAGRKPLSVLSMKRPWSRSGSGTDDQRDCSGFGGGLIACRATSRGVFGT
jgi:hypothetical protein